MGSRCGIGLKEIPRGTAWRATWRRQGCEPGRQGGVKAVPMGPGQTGVWGEGHSKTWVPAPSPSSSTRDPGTPGPSFALGKCSLPSEPSKWAAAAPGSRSSPGELSLPCSSLPPQESDEDKSDYNLVVDEVSCVPAFSTSDLPDSEAENQVWTQSKCRFSSVWGAWRERGS